MKRRGTATVQVVFWLLVAQAICVAQQAVDHRALNPLAETDGKPVVVIFVRTDCPISHRYAPEIRRLGEKYAGKVKFWLVYPSRSDTPQMIASDEKQFGYKLPSLSDPQQVLVKKAKAEITPEAAVFDQKGDLVYHGRIDDWYVGFGRAKPKPTTHDLDDAVQAVLDGRPVARAETKAVGCYISDLR